VRDEILANGFELSRNTEKRLSLSVTRIWPPPWSQKVLGFPLPLKILRLCDVFANLCQPSAEHLYVAEA